MHRLFLKDADSWTADDLGALVEAKIPEGMRVEYKRDLKLDKKSQKAELAKDVSGLANAQGGWLFFGITEDESSEPLPAAIEPLPTTGLQTNIENVLDTTLEPRPEFHASTIEVNGGVAIVMRIEPRTGNPIMLQGYGEYRYYRRNGTKTRQMTGTEVSEAYVAANERRDALSQVLEHLPLASRVARSRTTDELRLAANGEKKPEWLPLAAVVVAAIDCPRPLLKPGHLSPDAFPEPSNGQRTKPPEHVRPPGRWTLDAYGLHQEDIYEVGELKRLAHRVAIFREGVFEWARRYRFDDPRIPGKTLATDVHDALRYAAEVFAEVGYFGRLETHIRIDNAEKAIPDIPREWDLAVRTANVEWMSHFQEASVDELRVDPTPVVREAMNLIWQGFGVASCPYFDTSGAWLEG